MQNELIIVLVSAVLGGIVTYVLTKHFRERKILSYEVTCERSLINISPRIKDKIKVEWDGAPIEDASSFKVRLINDGNTPIKEQPILFSFDDGSWIVQSDHTTKPGREFGYVHELPEELPPNELKVIVELMNPKDEILFTFLTAESKSESLTLYAKGENLRIHKRIGARNRWKVVPNWVVMIIFFTGLGFITLVLGDNPAIKIASPYAEIIAALWLIASIGSFALMRPVGKI